MYFTQVGQIGTPVIVAKKAQLPTPNAANVGRYYITTYDPADSTDYPKGTVLTVKQDGSTFSLVAVFQMPAMTNPIESAADVINGKQAVDNKGQLVTGTFTTVEKTIDANGTFYPADDNAQAYSKVIVNVAGETAENPYIATTDSELEAYLAAEYKDSFVRMDYAKYRVALPANATYDQAKFNYESIGIPRMCAYIDKWLGSDSNKVVLNLNITSSNLTADAKFTVYKFSNSDGTYGYAASVKIDYNDGTSSGPSPAFLYHIKSGTVIDIWTADKDYNVGWTNFGGDTGESTMETLNGVIQLLYQGRTGSYTVAVSDALVLTNMAGSEVDNKYVEGAVYKVAAKYNEVNTYVAESPFQVGDQLAGATFYVNQQLTYEEFYTMFISVPSNEFSSLPAYILLNYDNPHEIENLEGYGALVIPSLLLQDGESLISYGLSLENPFIFDPNMGPDSKAAVTSIAMPASVVIEGTTIATPATITKINRPDIFNAIFGKTANFTKQSTIVTTYVPVLQASNGVYEEAQTEAKLDAKIVNDNIGKIYQYTGATGNKYKNQSLYIIMED